MRKANMCLLSLSPLRPQPRSVLSSPTPAPPSSFLPDCISMTGADRPPRMEPARPLVLWLGGGEGHWATDLVRPDAADAEDGDDDGGEWREVGGVRVEPGD